MGFNSGFKGLKNKKSWCCWKYNSADPAPEPASQPLHWLYHYD